MRCARPSRAQAGAKPGSSVHALQVEVARHGSCAQSRRDLVARAGRTRRRARSRASRRALRSGALRRAAARATRRCRRRSSSWRRNTSPTGDCGVCDQSERARRRLHELGRDAQLVARAQQRADEDEVHVGLRRDAPCRSGASPAKRAPAALERTTSDRSPPSELDTASASASDEEVDLRIGPQQAERQHRPAGSAARAGAAAAPASPSATARARAAIASADGVALGGRLGQRAADHAVEGHHRRRAGQRRRLLVQRRVHHLHRGRAGEGRPPRRASRTGSRPPRTGRCARRSASPEDLLGRHVARRAHDQARSA